jgi:hypothetical protein
MLLDKSTWQRTYIDDVLCHVDLSNNIDDVLCHVDLSNNIDDVLCHVDYEEIK